MAGSMVGGREMPEPLLLLASMPGSPGELLLPLRSHLALPWALRGGSLTKVSLDCAC